MSNEQELGMGLFGGDADLELNLGFNPDDTGLVIPPEPEPEPVPAPIFEGDPVPEPAEPNPLENKNNNPIEEPPADPEIVGGGGPDDGGDAVTSPNLYSSFASELHDRGILPSLDLEKNKIEDTDNLAKVIKGEIDAQSKAYIVSKIGEDGFDALEKGVSLAQYQAHTQAMGTLDSITDEVLQNDIEVAKNVILQDYINQGLPEDRARRILQKSIDSGDAAVLEDARESMGSLRKYESARIEQEKINGAQRIEAQAAQQEKIDNDLKNAIYNKKEFIEGIPSNKAIQDRVYKAITEIVGEDPNGVMENKLMQDRRQNAVEFDAKLYYIYELTNGFKDFSKITSKAATKATSDFEKVLRQTKFDDGGTPSYVQDKDSYDGIGSEIVF